MSCKTFHTTKFKKMMTSVIILSIFAMILPCSCMAEKVETSKNDHPCHSSHDESGSDQQSKHDNCCCTDGIYTAAPDLKILPVEMKWSNTPDQSFVISYAVSFLFNQLIESPELIRGSPPTERVFSFSSKTFLARIQRWLI